MKGAYTDGARNYIAGQEEHHRKWTFEQEFLTFFAQLRRAPIGNAYSDDPLASLHPPRRTPRAFRMGLENYSTGEIS